MFNTLDRSLEKDMMYNYCFRKIPKNHLSNLLVIDFSNALLKYICWGQNKFQEHNEEGGIGPDDSSQKQVDNCIKNINLFARLLSMIHPIHVGFYKDLWCEIANLLACQHRDWHKLVYIEYIFSPLSFLIVLILFEKVSPIVV